MTFEQNINALNMFPDKKIDPIAAEMVHEIRNPLTTVKGFLQLIKPYLKDIGKEEYAAVAISELNRTLQLISAFLQEAKCQTTSKENLYINKMIKELVILYESETSLKNIELTAKLTNQEAFLKIPESQLKQVLINLINNAIEAIDESSPIYRKITITTHIDQTTASIKVTDSCGGITNETKDNLFIPYYSSKKTGTGIGLCICKKIIEEYNGTIDVESIPGKLTAFTISFPFEYFSLV